MPRLKISSSQSKFSLHNGLITGKVLAKLSLVAAILSGITLVWGNRGLIMRFGEQFGVLAAPVEISGTGSMAPTFPIGQGSTSAEREKETVAVLNMKRYPGGVAWNDFSLGNYSLGFGDLVFVRDTREGNVVGTNGLIKRVIGLPGDEIEIRDGFVWRNGEQLVEPYTLQPRSTFGGLGIQECTVYTVPNESIMILGDNRKLSDDSRFRLGFVPLYNVQRYYPWSRQEAEFGSLWRSDAAGDAALAGQATFDSATFVRGINELRQSSGLEPLTRTASLNTMAQNRAVAWSRETTPATSSAAILGAANQAGYTNPLVAELPVSGFYTSEEMLTAVQEISQWQEALLRPDYQDIGIGVQVSSGACPKQAVVITLGGYVPARYDQSVVQSWRDALQQLQDVRPSWVMLETNPTGLNAQNKLDLRELLGIMDTRIERISGLVRSMDRAEWLTDEQQMWLEEDAALAERQVQLSNRLNSR